MLRRIKRGILAGWWALHHADQLTMLQHDLIRDGAEKNSCRGMPLSAGRAQWYLLYLDGLPIH